MLYLMLIYHDNAKMKAATAEEQAALGKAYGEFNTFLAGSGALRGTATWPANVVTLRPDGEKKTVSEGTYEANGPVAGFFLVDVEDRDAAVRIAERVPSFGHAGVEIRPVKE